MSDLKELTYDQREDLQKVINELEKNESAWRDNKGLKPQVVQVLAKPTVGRIVHYLPHPGEFDGNDSSPLPAIIVRVWSDVCVNLKVFTDGPADIWKTSVCQKPEGVNYTSGFWDWPSK